MLQKTEALVLHSLRYGEQKLVVDMFSRLHGRLSFIVPVPKSSRAKMKKQYFQPLTLLDIEADLRPQAQLQRLHDATLLLPLPSLQGDPSKLAISLFCSEFLYHALRDEQQNEPLFCYLRNSIEWLDRSSRGVANFHLVFLMHLSRFLGFYPNLEDEGRGTRDEGRGAKDEVGGRLFDLREGQFCTRVPMHTDFLAPDEAAHIRLLMRMDYATMHLFRLNRQERNRILDVLLHYYRLHLPALPELRSLGVFRELYAE